jgi:hypothetical protein
MLVELKVALMSSGAMAVRLMVPVNPPVGLTAMVKVDDEPAAIVRMVGVAESEKSGPWTVTCTVMLWNRLPLMPETSTV